MPKKKKAHVVNHRKLVAHHKAKRVGWDIRRIYYFMGLGVIALLLSTQLTYTKDFRASNVLGDDSGGSGGGGSSGGGSNSGSGSGGHDDSQQQVSESNSNTSQQGTTTQTNSGKNETDVQSSNGVKVKTKLEDNGTQKIEAEGPTFHFKFEDNNGEIEIEAVNDEGDKISTQDAEIRRLVKHLEDKDIKISSEDGEMEVEHNGVIARTHFPLSIDPITNQLIVTTPAGQKVVAVLPDDAISNMLANGFLTTITPVSGAVPGASPSGSVASSFEIEQHNGTVVYKVQGEKVHNLLGFFPVTTPRTVLVSAENGQAVSQLESWFARFVGLLSF